MPLAAVDSFSPLCTEPGEFDAFWSATSDRILEVDPQPTLARQQSPAEGLTYDRITFTSLGGVEIAGYMLTHDGGGARPLILHSHGYNSQYDVMLNWAKTGCNVMGIDFRGFGRSAMYPLARGSYVLTGIESPQSSILRGAVADLVQAMRTARALLGWRVSQMTLYGFSFGGAIAIMASVLDGRADLLVAGQPTFGWHGERLRLSTAGSSAEINAFIDSHPSERQSVMQTLNYFDAMHFASRLTVPAVIGVGLDDNVVPSRSVIAVANYAATPRLELRILPVAHSDDPRESLWASFDDEWLAMTRDGLPADFGAPERQVASIEPKAA